MKNHIPIARVAHTWLILLQLVCMSTNSLARVNCGDPAKSIGRRPYHPSCCIEQIVDSDTIETVFTDRKVSTDQWELDVNISWARPSGIYFNAYGVGLDYTPTLSEALTCDDDYEGYVLTETEWIYYKNVPFGYSPFVLIYTANTTAQLINREPNKERRVQFADCYETTESISFCQTRVVQVASKPIGLRVVSIRKDSLVPGLDLPSASITVSWHPPLQINPDVVALSQFLVDVYIDDIVRFPRGAVQVSSSQRNYTDPFSLVFNYTIDNVEVNGTTNLKIVVQPQVEIPGKSVCDLSCFGTTAELEILLDSDNFTMTAAHTLDPLFLIIVSTVAAVGTALLILACVLCSLRRFNRRTTSSMNQEFKTLRRQHIESNFFKESDFTKKPEECFAAMEFNRNLLTDVNPVSEIGKGSFGVVYKRLAYGLVRGKPGYYPVAVKGMKDHATADMKASFLEEIKLMIELGRHPNILPVLGCCTVDEPYYLIAEFMKYGDLRNFLLKTRQKKMAEEDPIYLLTNVHLLQIARQVARGMEYVSNTRYYHGDLAARNVLVGERLLVKVSDFGLADDIYERGYKRLMVQDENLKLPVKWVSIETLVTGVCTIQSDIWSFGVLLYEIFTRANVPYPGMDNKEILTKLKEGYRMERPEQCSSEVYDIMLDCWHETPPKRPTFTSIGRKVDDILGRHSDYMCLEDSATSTTAASDSRLQASSTVSSEHSIVRQDELQLWLHLHGPLPEDVRTTDFVAMGQESRDSEQSNASSSCMGVQNPVYIRDRDCDKSGT